MNKKNAIVIADSISNGNRITSYLLTVPQIIVKELLRHRMFSFSSSSMRAIPFNKVLEDIRENMFVPLAFQSHHSGMQGSEYLMGEESEKAKQQWIESGLRACEEAERLYNLGVTKQLCSRIIEPFGYAKILITATEFENFFELRCPKYQTPVSQTIEPQRSWKDLIANHSNPVNLDMLENNKDNIIFKLQHNKGAAEIHIMDLAEKMWDAYNESTPKQLKVGEWHIPFEAFKTPKEENTYIDWEAKYIHAKIMKEKNRLPLVEELISESKRTRIKIATARCARISYETLGDNPEINYEKDIKLHDDLLVMKHFSPFEHCCVVPSEQEYNEARKGKEIGWFYNLKGFKQYREIIE